MLQKVSRLIDKTLNLIIVISLAAMCILIFSNVVSRYLFDSSITWANEMSRFFFVWLVFFGAISALKTNEHMNVDFIVKRFPKQAKKIVYIITNLISVMLLAIIFYGSISITKLSMNSPAPATGIPFALINVMGIIVSIGMILVILFNLFMVLVKGANVDDYIISETEVDDVVDLNAEGEALEK